MKKLQLKALQLGAKELLTKEQMKKINGGTGCKTSTCYVTQGPGYCTGNGITIQCQCVVYGISYSDIGGCSII